MLWELSGTGAWRRATPPRCYEVFDAQAYAAEPPVPGCAEDAPGWTRAETDELLLLARRFNLNFWLVCDRINEHRASPCARTVPDVKARYYELAARADPVAPFQYDADADRQRRSVLEALHARPAEQALEDAFVVEYLEEMQRSGVLRARLTHRINLIKTLAGDQFTAGWPTLPELLKVAAGKGSGQRFLVRDGSGVKRKKVRPAPNRDQPDSRPGTGEARPPKRALPPSDAPPPKKARPASTPAPVSESSIGLRSARLHPLRVGAARAVEKLLAEHGLPLRPECPTAAVVAAFDELRRALLVLIDVRKGSSSAKPQ